MKARYSLPASVAAIALTLALTPAPARSDRTTAVYCGNGVTQSECVAELEESLTDNGQRPCQEDQPCWDCRTMGNRICGPQPHYTDTITNINGTLTETHTVWFDQELPHTL